MTARIIVEADGGSRGNPGPASYGALIRDADTGVVIAQLGETIGRASNNVAEYRGLIAGLELAREHAPEAEIEVRMDSKLVIEQMAGRWKVKHPQMRPLAIGAQRLAPFGTVWTWVPREMNTAADRLANLAMDAAARGELYDVGAGDSIEPAANQPGDPTPAALEPVSGVGGSELTVPPDNAPGSRNPMLGWSERLGAATTLIFLRHGVTRLTTERKFSGPGGEDPGLTDEGWTQADRAAKALASDGGVDAILASPLQRTRDTASAVSKALDIDVIIEDDFRECAFGDWDGSTFADVQGRWPGEVDHWLSSMDYAPPGGGESIAEVQRRVEGALSRTLASYAGKTVVVVSHLNPIKLSVRYCLDVPLTSVNRMLVAPASFTTLSFYESGPSALRQFSALP